VVTTEQSQIGRGCCVGGARKEDMRKANEEEEMMMMMRRMEFKQLENTLLYTASTRCPQMRSLHSILCICTIGTPKKDWPTPTFRT
jgi:hypothetical protein